MAGKPDETNQNTLRTKSTEGRKLIGQAIIDGLLTPGAVFLPGIAATDYNQGQGNYTQKGGDHKQGPGDYNQSPAMNREDWVTNVIREVLGERVTGR